MAKPPESFGVVEPPQFDPASTDFAELRELLLGVERKRIKELERKLAEPSRGAEELADQLPEAVALRSGRDQQLARALAPTMERAISESVRRNPREIATAIFPVLGPAIRKALAEAMAALVASINRAVEHAFSLRGLGWRLEAWRTGTPYAQIVLKHALVYRVEQVFLIHAETGLLLAHAAPPDLKVTDADLISGMLTAIQDFVSDSFKQQEQGRLRTFSVGELNVIVESGPQAILAAVIRGQPPESLLHKLQDALGLIHLQFAAAFADFQGDTAPFAGALPLLESCLETVLSHQRPLPHGRRSLIWLRWAIPLLLLVGFLGWRAWRARQRFVTAVARLEAEPGIQIVEARRGGGKWHLRGLKDPLAAEPAVVLAGLGAEPRRLDTRFEPYLSLEPSLVVARAAQALAAPRSITLRLGHDTLYASGQAPLAWAGRAIALPLLPPGVSVLELSAVEPTLPPELALQREQLESRLVLFEVGSAIVPAPGRRGLDSVATAFGAIRGTAEPLGYQVELDLFGRTDASGSDALNRQLSSNRVAAVSAALAGLGVPAANLTSHPLGTSAPLAGRDSLDQARINRSVTFGLRVRLAGSR